MAEIELTLNSPITEEQWDAITDVDFDHTDRIWFHTKHSKQVEFIKSKPVTSNADRIRSMSDEELAKLFGQSCDCDNACCFVYDKDVSCMNGCASAWLDWLKQEVERDEP